MNTNKCLSCRHYGSSRCSDADKYTGYECVLYSASPNARANARNMDPGIDISREYLQHNTNMSGGLIIVLSIMVINAIRCVYAIFDEYSDQYGIEEYILGNLPLVGATISLCILAAAAVITFIDRLPSAVYYAEAYAILVIMLVGTVNYIAVPMHNPYIQYGDLKSFDVYIYISLIVLIYLLLSKDVARVIPRSYRKLGIKNLLFIAILFALPLVPLYQKCKAQADIDADELYDIDYNIGVDIIDDDRVSYADGRMSFVCPAGFESTSKVVNDRIEVFDIKSTFTNIRLVTDFVVRDTEEFFESCYDSWSKTRWSDLDKQQIFNNEGYINGNHYYYRITEYGLDDGPMYWRFAYIYNPEHDMGTIISCYDPDNSEEFGMNDYIKDLIYSFNYKK